MNAFLGIIIIGFTSPPVIILFQGKETVVINTVNYCRRAKAFNLFLNQTLSFCFL